MPAMAQMPDGLQIYGRVNVTGERITVDDSSNTAVQPNQSNYELVDNSSRIGLRYKKELVPGNSILFQIESRVNLTDGGDVLSSRDSYVGLQGDSWGTIRLGRTIGPVYYATYDYISMHNHDTGTSSDALLARTVVGNQGFMNNTLWYTSPKFGGVTIDFAFSLLGEERVDPGMDQPRHLGLVASYDAGPLHLAVSYANTKNDRRPRHRRRASRRATPPRGPSAARMTSSSWCSARCGRWPSATSFGGSVDSDYWRVAAMFPFGQHELHINYGLVDADTERRRASSGRSVTTTTSPSRPRCTRSTPRWTTTATATS